MDKIILTRCELRPSHGWMTFALWYSLYKKIPGVQLKIVAKRSAGSLEPFAWTRKVKVPFLLGDRNVESFLEVPPCTVAVRDWNENNLGPVDCRSGEFSTFVTYFNGVGKFVVDDGIDNVAAPFDRALERYATLNLTVNERAILKQWEQMNNVVSLM